ncbi:hypothetical protein D3C74_317180 [compost metagenome]
MLEQDPGPDFHIVVGNPCPYGVIQEILINRDGNEPTAGQQFPEISVAVVGEVFH